MKGNFGTGGNGFGNYNNSEFSTESAPNDASKPAPLALMNLSSESIENAFDHPDNKASYEQDWVHSTPDFGMNSVSSITNHNIGAAGSQKRSSLHDSVKALEIMSPADMQQVPSMNLNKQQKKFMLRLNTNDDAWHRWIYPCNDSKTDIATMKRNQENKKKVSF